MTTYQTLDIMAVRKIQKMRAFTRSFRERETYICEQKRKSRIIDEVLYPKPPCSLPLLIYCNSMEVVDRFQYHTFLLSMHWKYITKKKSNPSVRYPRIDITKKTTCGPGKVTVVSYVIIIRNDSKDIL